MKMRISDGFLAIVATVLAACTPQPTLQPAPKPLSAMNKPIPAMNEHDKPSPKPSADSYIGMAIAEATRLANSRGLRNRIVSVDGQPRPVTKDLRPDRLNFSVVKGKVVRVTKG